MPLPPELDQKILNRFDLLIQEGSQLSSTADQEAFVVKALSLVKMVLGSSERAREIETRINLLLKEQFLENACENITGILRGLMDDYENGFLESLEEMIVANISADHMAQAVMLLSEGYHIPAAVMCGVELELALWRLCERQKPQVATAKRNGQPKHLNALIQDLQKAKVFNKLKADQLRSWTKVRNYAAHGEFAEFKRTDVESMINDVKNFLADYL